MFMDTYNGHTIFGNFNLYELTEENYSFEDTKINILDDFKSTYEKQIKNILKKNGIKLIGFDYFSPKTYNYSGDSIDIKISLENKKKILAYINKNKTDIQKLLDSNKSYDGYIALTPYDTDELIDGLKADDLSIIVLEYMLKDIKDDIFKDNINYMVFDNIEYCDDE